MFKSGNYYVPESRSIIIIISQKIKNDITLARMRIVNSKDINNSIFNKT